MTFGANLKRERELRAISLEEISKTTKISVRLLTAIEMDRYDIFPEGIFRKSFIKSYAKYLGMNEEKVLQEYLLATQAASPPSTENKPTRSKSYFEPPDKTRWIIPGLAVLLVVGAIYWFWNGSVQREKVQTSAAKATPSVPPAQGLSPGSPSQPAASPPSNTASPNTGVAVAPAQIPASPPASSSGTQLKVLGELAKKPEPTKPQNPTPGMPDNPALPGARSAELMLGIDATAKCWLTVNSGNALLHSGLLQPGESRKFAIQKPLTLTFGNAGGVRLSVNGKPLVSLGKPGEVRVLEINPDNYQRYLASTQ
jgi:cytoskeleton protein RodZ